MEGIPFAKPPVNNLRWKATQEANSWSGRLEATDFKQACFQRGSVFENNDSEWSGNEDCLYLNIWTPKLSKEQIEHYQRVIIEFEEAEKLGNASIKVDGKLVDYAMYNQAKILLKRFKPDNL